MATNDNNQGDKPATSVADIRKVVETANTEDENLEDDEGDDDAGDDNADDDNSGDDAGSDADDSSDSDDSDTDEGDDEDEDEDADADKGKPGEKKDPKSRRFSQFAGDGSDEAYLSNLEKGYQNSSAEAIRLKGDLDTANSRVDAIMRAAQSDPDLAAKLNKAINDSGSGAGGSGSDGNPAGGADNPFVRNLQSEWQEKSEKEIETFIEANPEVATDPQIAADVKHWMNVFSTDAYERTGKLMTGGEAMALAYKHLGLENKLGKQNLADGAKKTATPTRSRGKAKKSNSSKPSFTSDQLAFAQAMGKDESWLAKNAK